MARAFESVIRLQLEKYGPEAAKRKHIEVARKGLSDFLRRQNPKPGYEIETDGRPATNEESVKPFGVITYRFRRMREIAEFCLAEARRLSPRGTKPKKGRRYADSWFVMVDGQPVEETAVPPDAKQMHVTNDQPYSRKINVGAKGFEKYVPPGIVEKVRQAAIKRFGSIATIEVDHLKLQGGYQLLKQGVRRRKNGTIYARPDMKVGADLTYPAVSIRPKF